MTDTPFTCPECSQQFENNKMLGLHRYRKHGWTSDSPEAQARRAAKERRQQEKREAKAAAKAGHKADKTATPAPQPDPEPVPAPNDPEEIPEAMLGYGVGKLESLAEQMARDNGYPAKPFIRRLATAFAETQAD
jgi:uncharacterized C2H2 Zn-finger protein